MDKQNKFRIPVSAIALDLVGCLLIVLGATNLAGLDLPFLPAAPEGHNAAWTLVVFGVVFVAAATMLIIGVLLARRNSENTHPTVDRRSR